MYTNRYNRVSQISTKSILKLNYVIPILAFPQHLKIKEFQEGMVAPHSNHEESINSNVEFGGCSQNNFGVDSYFLRILEKKRPSYGSFQDNCT